MRNQHNHIAVCDEQDKWRDHRQNHDAGQLIGFTRQGIQSASTRDCVQTAGMMIMIVGSSVWFAPTKIRSATNDNKQPGLGHTLVGDRVPVWECHSEVASRGEDRQKCWYSLSEECIKSPMPISALPKGLRDNYEIYEWRHASAILERDFPSEWAEVCDVLGQFRLCQSFIEIPGGRKSQVSGWIDGELLKRGWQEKEFDTSVVVDGQPTKSPTHAVDCYKNRVALEIEWNNKDPFYDRDLNNFRLLFELRVISVGIIVTRCDHLQEIFDQLGRGKSYGASTTHLGKLLPKIEGGGGGGCPVLVFGITKRLYDKNC